MEKKIVSSEASLLPIRVTDTSMYFKLFISDDINLEPGKIIDVGTGIKINFNCKLYCERNLPKEKNLIIPTGIVLIDQDYRDEIILPLQNIGKENKFIRKGYPIAYMDIIGKQKDIEIYSCLSDYKKWKHLIPTSRGYYNYK